MYNNVQGVKHQEGNNSTEQAHIKLIDKRY